MYRHKVHIFDVDGDKIAIVPTLDEVYLLNNKIENFPAYVCNIKRLIFPLKREKLINKNIISFSLFGGEPTLNWNCVEKSIEIANDLSRQTGIECNKAIVTNGVFNIEKAKFLTENFNNIYFSIDGPKEMFVQQRRPKNDDVCDVIINNAKYVYNHGKKYRFQNNHYKLYDK